MQSRTQVTVSLSLETLRNLASDVRQRRHIEACGLLLGSVDARGNWHITAAIPLQNVFSSPVYFEFAPEELIQAELEYADRIVGVYHSHPTGFARASKTDQENMQRVNVGQQIPWVWLIICGPFDTLDDNKNTTGSLVSEQKILAYHHFNEAGLQQLSVIQVNENENTL